MATASIGDTIWILRQARRMTPVDLATRMGTTRQQVGAWEIGRMPTVAHLLGLSHALHVAPASLMLIAEARRKESSPPPR